MPEPILLAILDTSFLSSIKNSEANVNFISMHLLMEITLNRTICFPFIRKRLMFSKQIQVFIETKGTHLLSDDAWEEGFMLKMKNEAHSIKIFKDNNT